MMNFASRTNKARKELKELREVSKIKNIGFEKIRLVDVAKATGLSISTISRFESGDRSASPESLEAIEKFLEQHREILEVIM